MRWFFACAIAVVVAGSAGLVYLAQRGGTSQAAPPPDRFTAAATWAAGKRPAPSFSLRDQNGKPISMSSLRGHPVVVTFIDPVCRNLCPIEARVLSAATAKLPAKERPTIVAVSVNPWANTKANFAADRVHWKLGPNWRWAVGTRAQLTRIWHQYEIDVLLNSKTINGITVHEVVHTEASYVVDGSGFERAVYIYPFSGSDLAQEVRDVATS